MEASTTGQASDVQRAVVSLISKSAKALEKLRPGTWQRTMLQDNLRALNIGAALMETENRETDHLTVHDRREALRALARMISKTRKAHAQFAAGTSQHTLLRNRLQALRAVEARIRMSLGTRSA